MLSCPRTATLAVLVLACMVLVAQCARIGDSGKGWRVVKSDSADGLTCAYNGEFRLRAVGSRCGGKRYLSSRRTCKSTRGYNFNVELGKTKSTWSIQPKAGAYSIVDANANAKGCPYRYLALGPDTDQSSGMADYEEDEIELVTSRWDGPYYSQWDIVPKGDVDWPSKKYCTEDVFVQPRNRHTNLYHTGSCDGFIFDGYDGEWVLEAV